MAYKINFLLMIIGPALVFFLIKYNLWVSIYSLEGITEIKGYTLEAMIGYQAWVLLVELLAKTSNGRNLAEDIRLGRVTTYLIYPFDFWKFHSASFLGTQVVQCVIFSLTFVIVLFAGLIEPAGVFQFLAGVGFALLVGILWYSVQFFVGMMAFWLEETWMLRVIFQITAAFLSGAIIPLELYPSWLVQVLDFTPFPYMTFYPIKVFQGEYSGSLLEGYLILFFWIFVIMMFARFALRRGMRLYTAAGM